MMRSRKLVPVALAVLQGLAAPEARVEEPRREEARTTPDLHALYEPTATTRAVDRGLEYLDRTQLEDGSWISPMGKNTGILGLGVMAFLAAGHEPGRGKHGRAIDRGIAFLLDHTKDGMVVTTDTSHGPMYEHGIATLLLGEVLGMVNEEREGHGRIARVHRNAVNLILRAQNVPRDHLNAGGWRYTPSSNDADLSVTGWQLLALRAAQDAGLPVPRKNIEQAVLYVKRCATPTGDFSYMPGSKTSIALTGTGVLALEICGDFRSPEALRGGDWLLAHPLEWKGPFFYYSAYYSSQAMYQLGGKHWEAWRPIVEGVLLQHQRPDGSWPAPPNETHEHQAGPAYTTAMAILSLTVEYRYLPIYQR